MFNESNDHNPQGYPITLSGGGTGPVHHQADEDGNCIMEQAEIMGFVENWYMDSTTYTITELMEGIGHYHVGTYC